jgi:deoxyribonuclease-4
MAERRKRASVKRASKPAASKKKPSRAKPRKPKNPKKKAVKMLPAARKQVGKRAFDRKSDSAYDPRWVAPLFDDDILIGAHVSIAGGTHEAPFRAKATGASAMQIFTKMANRWAERTCEDEECTLFRVMLADTAVRQTVAHDSYLINLASPDAKMRRQSIESFVAELRRCEALGLDYLVSHPGNFMDDRASGLARNADGIAEALERVPGRTVVCMETTAGSGTALGATFEELATLFELIPASLRQRMGVCVDTCHAYSAGYDLRGDFDGVWARFDDTVGRDRLRVMHLNDSKTPFGSRRDRHELIAEGSLGDLPFRRIMTDARFDHVPKILETPKQGDATATDTRMILRLRGYKAG